MSYLLDAIRKAEKQRNHDEVPTLEGLVHERRERSAGGRRGWLIWVLLGIVVVVSIYLNLDRIPGWLAQGRAVVGSATSQIAGLWQGDEERSATSTSTQPAAGSQPTNAVPQPNPAPPSRVTDAQRALISQIAFTVLSYSTDDNKRFVMVGGRTLREGDLLEGFVIRQIQQDGVVILVNDQPVLVRP